MNLKSATKKSKLIEMAVTGKKKKKRKIEMVATKFWAFLLEQMCLWITHM